MRTDDRIRLLTAALIKRRAEMAYTANKDQTRRQIAAVQARIDAIRNGKGI